MSLQLRPVGTDIVVLQADFDAAEGTFVELDLLQASGGLEHRDGELVGDGLADALVLAGSEEDIRVPRTVGFEGGGVWEALGVHARAVLALQCGQMMLWG